MTEVIAAAAAVVGVLLALALRVGPGAKAGTQAYEFIAAEQRTLKGLEPDSFAATQLRQTIDAQVLVLNNDLVLPVQRRRAALFTAVWAGLVAAQVAWLVSRDPATRVDVVVTLFGIGFFATQLVGSLRVLFHRNRIRDLEDEAAEPTESQVEQARPSD